uniref:Uncharacterized protein n=1 Tax=Setaria italica TaxID=4555 RepID=K3YJL7_SETIT
MVHPFLSPTFGPKYPNPRKPQACTCVRVGLDGQRRRSSRHRHRHRLTPRQEESSTTNLTHQKKSPKNEAADLKKREKKERWRWIGDGLKNRGETGRELMRPVALLLSFLPDREGIDKAADIALVPLLSHARPRVPVEQMGSWRLLAFLRVVGGIFGGNEAGIALAGIGRSVVLGHGRCRVSELRDVRIHVLIFSSGHIECLIRLRRTKCKLIIKLIA